MAETIATTTTSTAPPAAPPAPAAPQPAPPSQRPGAIPREQYDALPEDRKAAYAHVSRPGGGTDYVERSKLPSESGADSVATADTSATAQPAVTADGKLRIGSMELSEVDITGLMERHALEQSRKATMPATAAEYSLDLPSDFVMPEGQSFKWATDHPVLGPLIGQAKEFAFASGIDQPAFSKMMSLFAASQIHEALMISKAQAAEREKLGPNITLRVDAVTQFIRGTVGDDKISKGMTQRILTADDLVGWEKIIRRTTSQNAASFSQAHREPAAPQGRVSEEQYSAMSPSERWDYARGFDQKQFQNGGG
jgi:hypothetical protein